MSGKVFASVSMSLDGFIAPESPEDLMGLQWIELHRWVLLCSAPTDPSGTLVEADRPIAVFSGHDCARIPLRTELNAVSGLSCDHLEEQLLPFEALGRTHVVAAFPSYSNGTAVVLTPTIVRITASVDGTEVSFDPASAHAQVTLGEGESLELERYEPLAITSNEPVAVHAFAVSSVYASEGNPTSLDPSMTTIVPREQWQRDYPVYVPSTFDDVQAVVLAPADAVVTLDDAAIEVSVPAPMGLTAGSVALSPGQHRLRADVEFSVQILGVGGSRSDPASFAYPGGGALHHLNPLE